MMTRHVQRTCALSEFGECDKTFEAVAGSNTRFCEVHRNSTGRSRYSHLLARSRRASKAFADEFVDKVTLGRSILELKACEICGEEFMGNASRKYCDYHKGRGGAIKKKIEQEALFEDPRIFREVRTSRASEGMKILIINDLHRPFQDQATLDAVENFWDDFKPDIEILNGDTSDFYEISQYDKNPSRRFHLQDELDDSHRWLEHRANKNPNAHKRIFIEGNHEDRLRRWLWRYGKDLAQLRSLEVPQLLGLEELGFEHLPYMSVVDFLGYRIEHGSKTSASKAYPVNVSRYMAIATGSSGLCGHTHRFSIYAWADASGSHSYVENGCLCRSDLEYAPFPNWQQAFCFGVVHLNKVHLVPVQIYPGGFHANGEFYPRKEK